VALGTNLPHGALAGPALLGAALDVLGSRGLVILAASQAWESPAWPASDQPDYANAVAACDPAGWDPQALLTLLFSVEKQFGRVRGEPNAARSLDLDLIDFRGQVVAEEGLALPHPRAGDRAFVLAPLLEVAPDWHDPARALSGAALLQRAPDRERLRPIGRFWPT